MQPIPKTAYHSGNCDKHSRPWPDLNLGSLTPQSDALTTQLLRHCTPSFMVVYIMREIKQLLSEHKEQYFVFLRPVSSNLCIFSRQIKTFNTIRAKTTKSARSLIYKRLSIIADDNKPQPPVLQPLYRSTCVSQHLQLRTGVWCKVLLPACPC